MSISLEESAEPPYENEVKRQDSLEADTQRLKFFEGCEDYFFQKASDKKDSNFNKQGPPTTPFAVFSNVMSNPQPQPQPQTQPQPPVRTEYNHPRLSREDELMKEISRVTKKLDEVNLKLENSRVERAKLEEKIREVEERIKSEENTLVSEHPSDEEVQYFERLTEMAKEKARRSQVLKLLEQKENRIKQSLANPITNVMIPDVDCLKQTFNNMLTSSFDYNWMLNANNRIAMPSEKE